MKTALESVFLAQWQKKVVAFICAIIIWVLVGHSMTITKTFSNVSIRCINIPENKAVMGIQADGFLDKDVTLTLTGTKSVIEELTSRNLEVVFDIQKEDHWIKEISKKNLTVLGLDIDLNRHIKEIAHSDFAIELQNVVFQEMSVGIQVNQTSPIAGYSFLGVWPPSLSLKISAPEKKMTLWKESPLFFTLDLSEIKQEDLEALESKDGNEIRYIVSKDLVKQMLDGIDHQITMINEHDLPIIYCDFIKENTVLVMDETPLSLFYPHPSLDKFNPIQQGLRYTPWIIDRSGVSLLKTPIYFKGVASSFVEVMRPYLQFVVIVEGVGRYQNLPWRLEVMNTSYVERLYLEKMREYYMTSRDNFVRFSSDEEEYLTNRFRSYLKKVKPYDQDGLPFKLEAKLDGSIVILNLK